MSWGHFARTPPTSHICFGWEPFVQFWKNNNKNNVKMADFDAIYQDQPGLEEGAAILDDTYTTFVPDPIIVRGAGNITVWVLVEYFQWQFNFAITWLMYNFLRIMTQQTYISKIKSLHIWKMHRYFNINVLHNRGFYLSILLQSFVRKVWVPRAT